MEDEIVTTRASVIYAHSDRGFFGTLSIIFATAADTDFVCLKWWKGKQSEINSRESRNWEIRSLGLQTVSKRGRCDIEIKFSERTHLVHSSFYHSTIHNPACTYKVHLHNCSIECYYTDIYRQWHSLVSVSVKTPSQWKIFVNSLSIATTLLYLGKTCNCLRIGICANALLIKTRAISNLIHFCKVCTIAIMMAPCVDNIFMDRTCICSRTEQIIKLMQII